MRGPRDRRRRRDPRLEPLRAASSPAPALSARCRRSRGRRQQRRAARGDRASRRTLHGLGLIDRLGELGGWIAAADGTIDTSTRTARMATTMHFAMAENELDRFRETSAAVHRTAIMEKGRHMGPAPFGYRRDDEGRLVLDESEAKIVRQVFECRADGAGWVALARDLEEQNVRQSNGRRVNQHLLRRMVRRRVYVGEATHGKHSKPGAHEEIVDEALWAAANRMTPVVRSAPAGTGPPRQPPARAAALRRLPLHTQAPARPQRCAAALALPRAALGAHGDPRLLAPRGADGDGGRTGRADRLPEGVARTAGRQRVGARRRRPLGVGAPLRRGRGATRRTLLARDA